MKDEIVYQKTVTKQDIINDLEHVLKHEFKVNNDLTKEQKENIYQLVMNNKQLQENSVVMFIEAELAGKCQQYTPQNNLENELLVNPIREIICKVKGK